MWQSVAIPHDYAPQEICTQACYSRRPIHFIDPCCENREQSRIYQPRDIEVP